MIETNRPTANKPQRVCIRCGDANGTSLSHCTVCDFDLTSDLQQDYDLYRNGVPLDAPTGVGERAANGRIRHRSKTAPGAGGGDWRPYREGTLAPAKEPEPAKATMDLGAAVLAAVFDGPQDTRSSTLDIAAMGPFLFESPTLEEEPDPVGGTPSSAPRVEAPVIVGAATEGASVATLPPALEEPEEVPKPRVVGAVQDWVGISTLDACGPSTRPTTASDAVTRRVTPRRPVTAPSQIPTRTEIPKQPAVSEPISRRNHIRVGATTYIDDVETGFRRHHLGWWHHELAKPIAVAAAVVTVVVLALV